jgi:hypothetical protein
MKALTKIAKTVTVIATVAPTMLATTNNASIATVWTTKNGTIKQRESATGSLSAPMAVKVANALQSDLTQWTNGQYRPIVADLRALLSNKQALNVAQSVNLNPLGKAQTLAFIEAVTLELTTKNGLTVEPKGAKARSVALMLAIAAFETSKSTVKAVDAVEVTA